MYARFRCLPAGSCFAFDDALRREDMRLASHPVIFAEEAALSEITIWFFVLFCFFQRALSRDMRYLYTPSMLD